MANNPLDGKTTVRKAPPKKPAQAQPAKNKSKKKVYTEEDIDYDYERSVKFANRGCLIGFSAIALVVAGVLLWGLMFVSNEISGKSAPAEKSMELEIPSGAGSTTIANLLAENGYIGNDLAFRLYTRINGASGFRSGTYTFEPHMSYDEIIDMLTQDEAQREQISVTFKEGDTVWAFGRACEEAGLPFTVQEFIEAANDIEEYSDIEFFQYIDYDPDTWMKAEGYMAANTYYVYSDSTPYEVARRLYEQFNTELKNMVFQTSEGEKNFYEMLDYRGYSLRQAITLASMIEEEAGKVDENQAKVSGVFNNRLKREDINTNELPRRTLGSDVTFYYVRDWISRDYGEDYDAVPQNLKYAYLALDDADSREGLPVGPLSNPGLPAIKAALQPVEHNYFYFLTDLEGTYYYATTYREHENNIAKMNVVNDRVKAEGGSEEG